MAKVTACQSMVPLLREDSVTAGWIQTVSPLVGLPARAARLRSPHGKELPVPP